MCLCVFVCVGLLPRSLETICIDPHQTGFVGKDSDYLQLIKLWPSRAPREVGLRRGDFFWIRLTTASAQCLRLSGRFFFINSCNRIHNYISLYWQSCFSFWESIVSVKKSLRQSSWIFEFFQIIAGLGTAHFDPTWFSFIFVAHVTGLYTMVSTQKPLSFIRMSKTAKPGKWWLNAFVLECLWILTVWSWCSLLAYYISEVHIYSYS